MAKLHFNKQDKIEPSVVEKELPQIDINSLIEKVIALMPKPEPQKTEIPEVKTITHIKDVSSDVINEMNRRFKEHSKMAQIQTNNLISQFNIQNAKQKKINLILTGLLIITIFLHLL